MLPSTRQALLDRALLHAAAGTTDLGPRETEISTERYLQLETEKARLFSAAPLGASTAAALRNAGDFVSLEVAGTPVLLSRDKGGTLHAHVNACRHRGTRLVVAPRGVATNSFVCPYHGWAYGADGALAGMPHRECFAAQEPGALSLIPLPVAERAGVVWIRLQPGARDFPPADEALKQELAELEIDQHVAFKHQERTWNGNWKIFIDGALEAYHFRTTHRRSIYPLFFDNVMLLDRFGRELRLVVPKRSLAEAGKAESLRQHANIVYLLFPNVLLLVQSDHVVVIIVSPVSASQSHISVTTLVPAELALPRAGHWEKNHTITMQALDEDFTMGERVFAGIRSGTPEKLVLGRNEAAIAAFHDSLREAQLPSAR